MWVVGVTGKALWEVVEQIMYASQIEMSLDVSSLQNVLSSHAADSIL